MVTNIRERKEHLESKMGLILFSTTLLVTKSMEVYKLLKLLDDGIVLLKPSKAFHFQTWHFNKDKNKPFIWGLLEAAKRYVKEDNENNMDTKNKLD